jgi:hypothetical protein
VQAPELRARVGAQLRVEVGEWLVQQQHARPAGQRAGERDALALAAGELRGAAVEQAREPEALCDLRHAPARLRGRGAAGREAEADVLLDGQVREQREALEHHRHAAVGRRQRGDVAPAHADAARVRRLEAGDEPQQRALARPGGPEDREQLAVRDRERQAGQGGRAVLVGLRQSLDLEGAQPDPSPNSPSVSRAIRSIISSREMRP